MGRHLTPNGRGLGWRPSLPGRRAKFSSPLPRAILPPRVDMSFACPPPYDQGQLGSCTGNALALAVQFVRRKQGKADAERVPSRLMIYWLERQIEGTIDSDSGAQGYDGIAALRQYGVCFEDGPDGWPYSPAEFATRPPDACFVAATQNRVLQSQEVTQTMDEIRGCLASGYPICFGFTCYPALDSEQVAQSGVLPMPGASEEPIGGHEVVAIGYDDGSRMVLCRNSWGANWGRGGSFWMPYEYISRPDLASELVVVQLTS